MNRKSLITAAVAVSALCASPAQAMNWCALPGLIPQREADFEALAERIGPETGCAREPSDSAHKASWVCQDDPATETIEFANLQLIREPGSRITLLVGAVNMSDLGRLQACSPTYRIENTFDPGSILFRGSLSDSSYRTWGMIHLLSEGPQGVAILYTSETRSVGSRASEATEGIFGFTPRSYPRTDIEVAGKNIVSTPAREVLVALQDRGAKVLETVDDDGETAIWELGPILGLNGVDRITLMESYRHVLMVKYRFESVDAYRQYLPLLDSKYGVSRPVKDEGCTLRQWKSGDGGIMGKVCGTAAPELTLYNDIALEQVNAISKLKKEKATSKRGPTIDRDNF